MRPGIRSPIIALLALVLATGLVGCGSTVSSASGPIRLTDDLGHHITLKTPARRIVVLEPANFEIADMLGLRSRIVGIDTSIPQYTPTPWVNASKGLHSIGTAYPGVSAEAIVAARPTLVIATTGIAHLSQLSRFHIPVLVLNPQSVAGVYHDILLVGQATGTTVKAETIVAQMKRQVAAITQRLKQAKHHPTVFYDLGGLYTTGQGTFLNSLIQMAGGKNIGAALSSQQWPQVTAEQVVSQQPDFIIYDPSAGGTLAKESAIPGFSTTPAAQQNHIVPIPNSAYVNEPSPALVEGLTELAHILHPRLYP